MIKAGRFPDERIEIALLAAAARENFTPFSKKIHTPSRCPIRAFHRMGQLHFCHPDKIISRASSEAAARKAAPSSADAGLADRERLSRHRRRQSLQRGGVFEQNFDSFTGQATYFRIAPV